MSETVLLNWLKSDNAIDRTRAARSLGQAGSSAIVPELSEALRSEDVPWVKRAISDAIRQLSVADRQFNREPDGQALDGDVQIEVEAIQSKAIEESIGQLLHEIDPIVGSITAVASEEINDFENSRLKEELDLLDETLQTFEEWRKVERKPRYSTVNLHGLVVGISEKFRSSDVQFDVLIRDGLEIIADKRFLRIIFNNVIKNGLESTLLVPSDRRRPIVINAGIAGDVFWASVVDHGIGLPENREYLLAADQSTKPGHRGMGLGIAHKALSTLGGNWRLQNGASSGAVFEFEIPIVEM